jgi:long-subunit acyl-CoA synthetase (AMP-forming)
LNPAYNTAEVSFYLSDTQSKLVIVPQGATTSSPLHPAVVAARELKIPVAEIHFDGHKVITRFDAGIARKQGSSIIDSGSPHENDVALVLHTSGTTGRPKAVPLSHLNLNTTMQNIINTYKLTKADRTYLVMPLFHVRSIAFARRDSID